MTRLSSCYFCGDAVDAAVEEYPLVHSDRYDDIETDQRIVLCPSCRRKLTTVIERVLESAFDSNVDAVPADATSETDEDLIDVEADDVMTASAVETLDGSAEESSTKSATDEPDGFQYGDTESEEPDAEMASTVSPETVETDDVDDSDADTHSQGETDEDVDDDPAEAETEDSDHTGDEEESPAESASVDDEPDSDAADEESADEEDPDGDAADEENADDEESPEYTFERWQFNKIVRLLQNREFPVEIDELTVLADSAYEIDEPTTHEVIDALVERGVVVDNGETLTRPQ